MALIISHPNQQQEEVIYIQYISLEQDCLEGTFTSAWMLELLEDGTRLAGRFDTCGSKAN